MMYILKAVFHVLVVTFFSLAGVAAMAQSVPEGRVILSVTGDITQSNSETGMQYDLAMIDALGQTTVATETPWTEGSVRFEGVLVRDLLADAGATGTMVSAAALNDYTVSIPISDFERWDVILATRMDGEVLTVRNRGPLWIIFPWTDKPLLQNEVYYSRSIWQLKSLNVESN